MAAVYDYSPYGQVNSTGGLVQPVQWSSEMKDVELALAYYNYRYYNPVDGRWINRDFIAEEGGWNLYGYIKNGCWAIDELGKYPAPLEKGLLPLPNDYRTDPRHANVKIVPEGKMTIYGLTVASDVPTINTLYEPKYEAKCILIKDELLPQHPRIEVTYFYDRNYNPKNPRSGYRDQQGLNVVEHEDIHVSIEIEEWNSLITKLEEIQSKIFNTDQETKMAYMDLIEKRQDYKLTVTQRHNKYDANSGSPQH